MHYIISNYTMCITKTLGGPQMAGNLENNSSDEFSVFRELLIHLEGNNRSGIVAVIAAILVAFYNYHLCLLLIFLIF